MKVMPFHIHYASNFFKYFDKNSKYMNHLIKNTKKIFKNME